MAQSKLTYQDKTNLSPIVDRTKQATAEDFNEIKQVVNDNADDVDALAKGREGSVQFKKGTTFEGNDDFLYDEINKRIGLGLVPRFNLDIKGNVGSFALELDDSNPRISFGLEEQQRDLFTLVSEAARLLLNVRRGDFVISMNSEAVGNESLLINKDTGAIMIGPGTFTDDEQLKVNGDIVSSGNVLGLNITTISAKLANIEDGAQVNVQSDWNESDTNSDAFIKNKPTIPTPSVNTLLSFKYEPGTTGSGIAAGVFKLNNNDQSLATEIYFSFRSRNSFGLEDAKDFMGAINKDAIIILTYHQNATTRSVFTSTANAVIESDHIRIPISVNVSSTFSFTDACSVQVINDTGATLSDINPIRFFCSDNDSDLTADNRGFQYAQRAQTINSIFLAVETAPTGSGLILNVYKNGVSILTGNVTIAAGTNTLTVSGATITDTSISSGDKMEVKVISTGLTVAGAGLSAYFNTTLI